MSARSEITAHAPSREGNGSTRRWSRTIGGQDYSFNAVLMPDGERRYFATKRRAGQDGRFGHAWQPVLGWTFKAQDMTAWGELARVIREDDGTIRTDLRPGHLPGHPRQHGRQLHLE